MENSGLILFNKPSGITSFDALRDIKRVLGTGKVGHTGTLDKFASGLLIVLAGKALRLSRWFTHCDKKYTGKIHFGIETDTLDPEGKIIAQAPPPSLKDTEKALSQFTGDIMQAPPAYSAIHINGKRASSLARSGELPEMKKRPVTIYKTELVSWNPPFAEIFVHCSSGTYIRSLARDIAAAAGSRAHLCALLRTDIAGFKLESGDCNSQTQCIQAHMDYQQKSPLKTPCFLLPINKEVISRLGLPWYEVCEKEAQDIFNGKPLETILKNKHLINNTLCKKSAVVFNGETLIAVVEKEDDVWKYGCVIAK